MTRTSKELALATTVSFTGTARASGEVLLSPVSGLPCVHWRLRVVEHMTASLQLVHEASSPEAFEVSWTRQGQGEGRDDDDPGRPPLRVRVDPSAARIQAVTVLHRAGTPGALAAARHMGLSGTVQVEEVLIRDGETLQAQGRLDDPSADQGPFRATGGEPQLLDALVRVETRSLGPVLLPWALGTAAALLGVMGGATYAAWHFHVLNLSAGASHLPRIFIPRPELRPPEFPRRRLP
jgi:hypothetical protein